MDEERVFPEWLKKSRYREPLFERYKEGVRISLERLPEDIEWNGGVARSYEEMLRIVREHPEVYDYDEEKGLVLIRISKNGGNLLALLSPQHPGEEMWIEEERRLRESRVAEDYNEDMERRKIGIEKVRAKRRQGSPKKGVHMRKIYRIIK
ncbi:hypothetical protein COU61_04210 [Candidatus Pacearchaeota archaeon CG10_big_fil_rev_8_21_14_0_10_35_13]|nr:MAG: hypothetical protein COU61_04210 [Candidatus Pacearchaeota archaeon CG10_big_fil_rev_8_21_14_0_10_35_13]